MNVHFCIFALACFASVKAGKLPSFIKACSASDPNLSQCIERVIEKAGPTFANGIPDLGIAPLDPVQLGNISTHNPALKIDFMDTVVTGLGGLTVNAYKMNLKKGKATFDFTANVTLNANYDMAGQILILPIRGNGQAKIKINHINVVTHYTHRRRSGFYEKLKLSNNVFSQMTQKFTNENWQIIMNEIAPPIIKQIIKSCVDEVQKFFSAVPAEELITL
ncbi:hypothetical protein K1T71_001515 [Dendrolimus kikuchii]|uniref:Uncharacterized protein n=1 Tax=Dendrolimus kikuchii TaxID=765133 RepID=A0ACC1DHU4_9NEOP|nr:hypothetical protein K1T71_001515 [Dendrolimus kikuchii]